MSGNLLAGFFVLAVIYFGFVLIPRYSIFPQWKYCVFARGFASIFQFSLGFTF
jgi:hypothetical protein